MDETQVPEPVARVCRHMRNRCGNVYARPAGVERVRRSKTASIYHAYSTYARGLDGLWGMYQWLDRAPKGRNENGVWWKRHDEYDQGRDGS